VLRLISAVLHAERGPVVTDDALDLRPGEVAIVGAMLVCVLVLSAWPALVSERVFPEGGVVAALQERAP
jgi:hypothetical protein